MKIPASYAEFESALKQSQPPDVWPIELKALWWDAKGDWDAAHHLVDQRGTAVSKWIHAYLHRKEGDEWNAGYWYRQAGKPFCALSLSEEWLQLVVAILASKGEL